MPAGGGALTATGGSPVGGGLLAPGAGMDAVGSQTGGSAPTAGAHDDGGQGGQAPDVCLPLVGPVVDFGGEPVEVSAGPQAPLPAQLECDLTEPFGLPRWFHELPGEGWDLSLSDDEKTAYYVRWGPDPDGGVLLATMLQKATRGRVDEPFEDVATVALFKGGIYSGPRFGITLDELEIFVFASAGACESNNQLFRASRVSKKEPFGPLTPLGAPAAGGRDPWINADGQRLYFAKGEEIYQLNEPSKADSVPSVVFSRHPTAESQLQGAPSAPTLTRDELTMYFNSADYGGTNSGGGGVWQATRGSLDAAFDPPEKVWPSAMASYVPYSVSADGCRLYLSNPVNGGGSHPSIAEKPIRCDGSLVYRDWDPDHCGACGHSCAGAPCTNGRCEVLGAGQPLRPPVLSVVVRNGEVYWIGDEGTTINKVDPETDVVASLVEGVRGATQVVVDAAYAYFTSELGISKVPISGGEVMPLVCGARPVSIAIDATDLYWIDEAGLISRIPKQGGVVTELEFVGADPESKLVVDATNIFWVSNRQLYRMLKTVGVTFPMTEVPFSPNHIALDAVFVYWTEQSTIKRRRKDGFASNETLAHLESSPDGLVLDAHYAYWASPGDGLKRVSKAGGRVTTLSRDFEAVSAIDATLVYGYSHHYQSILMVAK